MIFRRRPARGGRLGSNAPQAGEDDSARARTGGGGVGDSDSGVQDFKTDATQLVPDNRSISPSLPFPEPCLAATFLGRPQRFLATMALQNGEEVVAYCANPGSFGTFLTPGSPAVLSDSANPVRRRRYTWKAVKANSTWVGTDTQLANPLAEAALKAGLLPGLNGLDVLTREVRTRKGCRLDFLLEGSRGKCFLEIKSATVVQRGVAQFPDSVTPRGLKHLQELACLTQQGQRAVLLFVIQRADVEAFSVVAGKDPSYAETFHRAREAGVEAYALQCAVRQDGVAPERLIPVL